MTIVRNKYDAPFTVLYNHIINDTDIDSRYLGVFVRLISKSKDWDISVKGLAKLYPSQGEEYYRNAIKHLCKLGYIVRIPSRNVDGKFGQVVMELYDKRQTKTTLTDCQVEALFSQKTKQEDLDKLLREIYPARETQPGKPSVANHTQQRKEQQKKELTKEKSNERTEINDSHCSSQEKSKVDWVSTLPASDQEIYHKLIKTLPEWGDKIDTDTLTYFLKKYGAVRTLEGYQVYLNRASEIKRGGGSPIKSMGAYIRWALENGKKPVNEDTEKNIALAKAHAKKHRFIDPLKLYCKFIKGALTDEIYYHLPHSVFKDVFERKMETFYEM